MRLGTWARLYVSTCLVDVLYVFSRLVVLFCLLVVLQFCFVMLYIFPCDSKQAIWFISMYRLSHDCIGAPSRTLPGTVLQHMCIPSIRRDTPAHVYASVTLWTNLFGRLPA